MRTGLLILIFFTLEGWSQTTKKIESGYDATVDIISEKYEAGPYLIYDCVDKHWVCVLEEFYRGCQSLREESLAKGSVSLACAPIGKFPTKRSCFQRTLFMATHNHGDRFCINDKFRPRELKL